MSWQKDRVRKAFWWQQNRRKNGGFFRLEHHEKLKAKQFHVQVTRVFGAVVAFLLPLLRSSLCKLDITTQLVRNVKLLSACCEKIKCERPQYYHFFYSLLFYGHAGYNHLFSFCFDIIDFIFIGILAGLEGGGQRINRK